VLTIDRLSLRLPPGFDDRAVGIAQLIGARLAQLPWPPVTADVDHVRVEYELGAAGTSDEAIAGDIAVALAHQIEVRGSMSARRPERS
jgi:hypothetical protein